MRATPDSLRVCCSGILLAARDISYCFTLDEESFPMDLVYEPGTGGELFPHIYDGISKSSIRKLTRIAPGVASQ